MAKQPVIHNEPDGTAWRPLGGGSRRYQRVDEFGRDIPGDTLSRTVWDERYGRLKRQGYATPHAQRAANQVAGKSRSRPAINRGTKTNIAGMKPLAGKIGRDVSFPVFLRWYGDPQQFAWDSLQFADIYNDAVRDASRNSRIEAVSVRIILQSGGYVTIIRLTLPHSMPDYNAFTGDIIGRLGGGDYQGVDLITAFEFHIEFKRSTIPASPRKEKLKQKKRLKTKR